MAVGDGETKPATSSNTPTVVTAYTSQRLPGVSVTLHSQPPVWRWSR